MNNGLPVTANQGSVQFKPLKDVEWDALDLLPESEIAADDLDLLPELEIEADRQGMPLQAAALPNQTAAGLMPPKRSSSAAAPFMKNR